MMGWDMKKSALNYVIGLSAFLLVMGVMIYRNAPDLADSDRSCVSDCVGRGFNANYCSQRCAPGDGAKPDAEPRCFRDCKSSGAEEAYCMKTCRY